MNSKSVIFTSMILQMKQTFARNMFKYCMFIAPILSTIILGEMYRHAPQEDFIAFVVLGSGLWNLWGAIAFSSAGDINRERYSNTLSVIFSAPADFRLIWLGKIFGNTILSICSFFISVIFALVLYRIPVQVYNWGLLALAFLLTVLSFIVISVFVAYLLTLSRRTTLFMNCLEFPFILICGFAFPVEMLPTPITYISYIFPPTWAVKLLRSSIAAGAPDYLIILLWLLVTTVGFVLVSSVLYRIIFKQVKVLGTLDMA